jgi:hemerythrin-like domain-containing protein
MSQPAIRAILEDHQALSAVLRSFQLRIERARRDQTRPDFGALRAMLFYLDEAPAHLHHTRGNTHLFPVLRERCPALGPVIDRLEADHAMAEVALLRLERAMLAFEVMGDSRREAFEAAAQRYVESYLGHLEVEENYLIPVALGCFTDDDWRHLNTAFDPGNDSDLHGEAEEYRQLLRRVLFQDSRISRSQ